MTGANGHFPTAAGSKPGASNGGHVGHGGRGHHHGQQGTVWVPWFVGPYGDYWDSPLDYSDAPDDTEQASQEPRSAPPPAIVVRENTPSVPAAAPQLIEVPEFARRAPAKPQPPALFVLADGKRIESHHYILTAEFLQIDVNRVQHTIPLSALDLDATVAANHERGIELTIPRDSNSVFVSF